ncbi:hypothetical protein KIN20_008331 [Parelaphostrongylus tenuis]|uniref:Uncharacterized protein n=1 Tax=Parelaphostrongylus tenuis TaxID=148309 RepID=A0AAD5M7U8_PARTN|nr:hypothetical protein KIN20_008331 [Parelaphostrongylus tenuis]
MNYSASLLKPLFFHLSVEEVNAKEPATAQLQLMFDNVSDVALANPELPDPFCIENASEFVELGSGSSECYSELTRWLADLFEDIRQSFQSL